MAAQVGRDGAEFFRRANRLAADPRAKFVFGRAAGEYDRCLAILEPLARSKKRAEAPSIFPFKEYERVDCYVCGHEASVEELPETCPSCGAAGYAFERDVTPESAWELVAKTTKRALAVQRKLAKGAKKGASKAALEESVDIGKRLLDEAEEHRRRPDGATG